MVGVRQNLAQVTGTLGFMRFHCVPVQNSVSAACRLHLDAHATSQTNDN